MAVRRSGKTAQVKIDARTRVLVLHGPEPMRRREYLDQLRQAITAEHGEVDPIRFDGETAGLADVLDGLRTLSLLSAYKIVVVDAAATFVTTHRKAMERYAESPVESATLVLISDTWRPGNLDKLIAKVGVVAKCETPSRPEATTWLIERAKTAHERKLSSDAAEQLVGRIGCDLMRLDSELGKLAVLVGKADAIDAGLIDELVGRGSDEQAWAIQEAVLEAIVGGPGVEPGGAGVGKVMAKIHELVELAGQADVLVTYFVADLFRKLYLAEQMQRQGVSQAQIGRELKLWGPRQRLVFEAATRLGRVTIGRLFDEVIEADRRAKSGRGDSVGNLECFVAQLADGW